MAVEKGNTGKPQYIAEGDWSLSRKLSNGTKKRIYQLDRTVEIDGMDLHFEKLEVSPLSCRVYVYTKDKKYMKLFNKLGEPGLGKLQCGKKALLGNEGYIKYTVED